MSTQPSIPANTNPYFGEAPMVDILIHTQKTNLVIATSTLVAAVLALLGIVAYVGLQGQLKITEAGIASGLPLITGIVSKLGINSITAHLGELQAARYLAGLPNLSPEQVAQFNALMNLTKH